MLAAERARDDGLLGVPAEVAEFGPSRGDQFHGGEPATRAVTATTASGGRVDGLVTSRRKRGKRGHGLCVRDARAAVKIIRHPRRPPAKTTDSGSSAGSSGRRRDRSMSASAQQSATEPSAGSKVSGVGGPGKQIGGVFDGDRHDRREESELSHSQSPNKEMRLDETDLSRWSRAARTSSAAATRVAESVGECMVHPIITLWPRLARWTAIRAARADSSARATSSPASVNA